MREIVGGFDSWRGFLPSEQQKDVPSPPLLPNPKNVKLIRYEQGTTRKKWPT